MEDVQLERLIPGGSPVLMWWVHPMPWSPRSGLPTWVVSFLLFFNGCLVIAIKGPDNPTSQLLPTSNKRKAKTAWGKQEREKRW